MARYAVRTPRCGSVGRLMEDAVVGAAVGAGLPAQPVIHIEAQVTRPTRSHDRLGFPPEAGLTGG
jgi:hypothetical protein